MEKTSPASGKRQGLVDDLRKSDSSKKFHKLHTHKNNKQVLDELARKWVRFGCVDTPNEAMRILLEGIE
jgi:hypothetical protein